MNTINMPGFSAEAALASGDRRHWGIVRSNENGGELRIVPSSLFGDILVGALVGFVTGGPAGAIVGGIAGGVGSAVGGGGDSGGGYSFAMCLPVGPCVGNGIRVGDMEMGAMAQICYPGELISTVPCWKGIPKFAPSPASTIGHQFTPWRVA